jgi:hypothetical protein
MKMNTNSLEVEKIKILLERLKKMLEEHRGGNHMPGVLLALEYISDDERSVPERVAQVRSIFRTMMGGMGTLGDFVIWDADEPVRASLNYDLNEILTELWNILEC